MKPIAIQLYTLRKDVYPGGDDLAGVLWTVAEIGYKGVEFAGLHGADPKEIAKILSDLGLAVAGSHTGIPTPENVAQIADTELALGNKKAIGGFGGDLLKTVDGCKEAAEKLQQAIELLKPYGMMLGIHNHWWEFEPVEGTYPYDIIMQEAPDIFSELDVYWAAWGKVNPIDVLRKYGPRIPLFHIKDGMLQQAHPHLAVGSGVLDMPAIIGAANPDVTEWLIVELDAFDGDMLEAVKESYRYLVSNGLAAGNK